MTAFLVGLICGASIAFPIYAVLCGASKEQPVPRAGPRLPHHRRNVASLPEWQEHQRDVDHLEVVGKMARDEAFWMGEKK